MSSTEHVHDDLTARVSARPLDGVAALVTGASSGIGAATGALLARAGADVALVARREDRLAGLAENLTDTGVRLTCVTADVSDEQAAEDAVGQTIHQLGRLDIVVANAGVMLLGPVADAPPEEWRTMIDVNLRGVLNIVHAALPSLRGAAERGPRQVADLVLTSSTAGRVVRNGSAVYAMTKHGVGAFGEGLRGEMAAHHVRVGLVEPGSTETELASHIRPEVREQSGRRTSGVERLQPEDIAEAILWMVTRPRHVAVNEMLVRPTEQED